MEVLRKLKVDDKESVCVLLREEKENQLPSSGYLYRRSATKKRTKESCEGRLLNDGVRLVSICLCVSGHKQPDDYIQSDTSTKAEQDCAALRRKQKGYSKGLS